MRSGAAVESRRSESAAPRESEDDTAIWRTLAAEAAVRYGTPCYVSRWRPVESQVARLERGVRVPVRSWLSFKTHPLPRLAAEWVRHGRGVEITSECEMAAVIAAGCLPDQLLVNGVAKHAWLPRWSAVGLRVHVDSTTEATELLSLAVRDRWRVGVRCHVPAEHDRREPRFGGPFGLTAREVSHVVAAFESAGVPVEGVHFHLGQGRRSPSDYRGSIDYALKVCRDAGMAPRYIDCGGGLDPGTNVDEALWAIDDAMARARTSLPTLEEVWLENGRFVTEASAALVVRVLDVKDRADCRYLICDGGRTNHALDADNGTHPIAVSPDRRGAAVLTTIAGPTCMTDDRLGRVMLPGSVRRGDLIAWLDAGAYHLPWETRFSHGLCRVVWADDTDTLSLVRAAETPEDWSRSWRA